MVLKEKINIKREQDLKEEQTNHKTTLKQNQELKERLEKLEEDRVTNEELYTKFGEVQQILNDQVSDFKNKLNAKDEFIKTLELQLKMNISEMHRKNPTKTMFERLKKVTTTSLNLNQLDVEVNKSIIKHPNNQSNLTFKCKRCSFESMKEETLLKHMC